MTKPPNQGRAKILSWLKGRIPLPESPTAPWILLKGAPAKDWAGLAMFFYEISWWHSHKDYNSKVTGWVDANPGKMSSKLYREL